MVLAKRVCDSVQSDNPLYSATVLFLHVNNTDSGTLKPFKTEMNGFDGRTDGRADAHIYVEELCMHGWIYGWTNGSTMGPRMNAYMHLHNLARAFAVRFQNHRILWTRIANFCIASEKAVQSASGVNPFPCFPSGVGANYFLLEYTPCH